MMSEFNVLLRNKAGYVKLGKVRAYDLQVAMMAAIELYPHHEVLAVGPHASQVGDDTATLYAVEKVTEYQITEGFKG